MLAEFFLTPEAFCCDSDNGYRELQACLFPFANVPIALICKLGNDRWTEEISNRICRIRDANRRNLAMDLLTKIVDDITVVRPSDANLSSDEGSWAKEAQRSRNSLMFADLVVSNSIIDRPNNSTALKDFVLPEYWDDHSNPRMVERTTDSQESVLRTFCAYSEWIIIRMPQIRGSSDDEIVTVKQIIALATSLPDGYPTSNIEIQFPLSRQSESNPDRVFRSVKGELQENMNVKSEIKVTMLPVNSFINREIIGGEYALLSSGEKRERARWLMTMNHVAVGGRRDTNRDDGNSWNLFSRRKANERLEVLNRLVPILRESIGP